MCLRRSWWPEKWEVPDRRSDRRVGQAQGMLSPVEGRPSFSHCDRSKGECAPAGKTTRRFAGGRLHGLCYSFDVGVRSSAEYAEVSGRVTD